MSKCNGCRETFASYNMTESDAVEYSGKLYCNMDCAHDTERTELDHQEWLYECGVGEYWEGV